MDYKVVLPLTDYAAIRPMTGVEEDLLLNKKLVESGLVINKIITNCVTELNGKSPVTEDDILKLTSADRLAILLELRKISLGDIVPVKIDCTAKDCRGVFEGEVDLNDMKFVAPEVKDPNREFVTEIAGKKVKFGYFTGEKENKLAKGMDMFPNEQLTLALQFRVLEVEGLHPTDVKNWLRNLPLRERSKLRNEIGKTECGYDTTIEASCPVCGKKLLSKVEQEADFYLPQQ